MKGIKDAGKTGGFFITGTDTGVGKTVVAGALVKALQLAGIRTGVMKPVESGCIRDKGMLVPSDGVFLRTMAQVDDDISGIVPYRFESPLAPLAIAEEEGPAVDIRVIRAAYERLSEKYRTVVVEGIGGLMVPITEYYFCIDLARDLGLPLIIAARPGLGTINHIMLTVECALRERLDVAGIIINYSRPPDGSPAEKTNPGVLAKVCPVPVLGTIPYLEVLDEETIERTAKDILDLERLGKYA